MSETPTTIGDTANGRSTIACTMPRPRKRPRTNASAVTTPNTTFTGTTIATISRLSESAEIAAGVVICSQKAPKPSPKVRTTIRPIGSATRMPR